jgi:hypothetical protein
MLAPLSTAMNDECIYWLVSDEIAIQTPKTKFVADILLVRQMPDGAAQLVNVELKSNRSMKTFSQVTTFRSNDRALQIQLQKFADIMTGQNFEWSESAEPRGIVIWLGLQPGQAAPKRTLEKIAQFKREGIDTIGYRQYVLALEGSV